MYPHVLFWPPASPAFVGHYDWTLGLLQLLQFDDCRNAGWGCGLSPALNALVLVLATARQDAGCIQAVLGKPGPGAKRQTHCRECSRWKWLDPHQCPDSWIKAHPPPLLLRRVFCHTRAGSVHIAAIREGWPARLPWVGGRGLAVGPDGRSPLVAAVLAVTEVDPEAPAAPLLPGTLHFLAVVAEVCGVSSFARATQTDQ